MGTEVSSTGKSGCFEHFIAMCLKNFTFRKISDILKTFLIKYPWALTYFHKKCQNLSG